MKVSHDTFKPVFSQNWMEHPDQLGLCTHKQAAGHYLDCCNPSTERENPRKHTHTHKYTHTQHTNITVAKTSVSLG